MALFSPIGWILLVAAFLSAAAEMSARVVAGSGGIITAAADVWQTLSPDTWAAFQAWAEGALPLALWNPVLLGLETLPGWLVLGLPGGLLAWFGRPHREPLDKAYEEQLFLYEELSKQALKDGYQEDKTDFFSPQTGTLELHEAGGDMDLSQHVAPDPPDKFLNDWQALREDKEHGLPADSEQPGGDNDNLNDWSVLSGDGDAEAVPSQAPVPPQTPDETENRPEAEADSGGKVKDGGGGEKAGETDKKKEP